ncbi:hypothetical protein [Bosea sp. ASV33]|uniref:hypothetical protein n=1 Tax=Bosea sp. ASV33 TaxID=2795106 RepID=UPI0018EB6F64|nr:hypothetical protein [Bosea sp. ASV33]
MGFFRQLVVYLIGTALLGALTAFLAKFFSIEKSTISTGMIGVGIGWGACWFWNAWREQPRGTTKHNPAINRRVPLEETSDKIRRFDSKSQSFVQKDEV